MTRIYEFTKNLLGLTTRTILQQAFKGVLNCCKQENAFKCQTRLYNYF